MNMRTPLKNVRRLGSAHEGADHFWLQRLTSVSSLVLTLMMVGLVIRLAGADYATAKATLASPLVSLLLLLLVVSGVVHMRIGMQVIIEDYVHHEGAKIASLMLNTFFSIAVAAASVWAILKLSFGV